jgi:hypothetical protein
MEETEKTTATVHPELSTEHKLAVREAQFILTNTREQAEAAVKSAEQAVIKVVQEIAKELKVVETAVFNFGPLTFTDKK